MVPYTRRWFLIPFCKGGSERLSRWFNVISSKWQAGVHTEAIFQFISCTYMTQILCCLLLLFLMSKAQNPHEQPSFSTLTPKEHLNFSIASLLSICLHPELFPQQTLSLGLLSDNMQFPLKVFLNYVISIQILSCPKLILIVSSRTSSSQSSSVQKG